MWAAGNIQKSSSVIAIFITSTEWPGALSNLDIRKTSACWEMHELVSYCVECVLHGSMATPTGAQNLAQCLWEVSLHWDTLPGPELEIFPSPGMQGQRSRKDPWASAFTAGIRTAAGNWVLNRTFAGCALFLAMPACWHKVFLQLCGRVQLINRNVSRMWQRGARPGHGLYCNRNPRDELLTGLDAGMWALVND